MSVVSYATFLSRNNAHFASLGIDPSTFDNVYNFRALYDYSIEIHALLEANYPGITENFFGEDTYKNNTSKEKMIADVLVGIDLAKSLTKSQVISMVEVTRTFVPKMIEDESMASLMTKGIDQALVDLDESWDEIKPFIESIDERQLVAQVTEILDTSLLQLPAAVEV